MVDKAGLNITVVNPEDRFSRDETHQLAIIENNCMYKTFLSSVQNVKLYSDSLHDNVGLPW